MKEERENVILALDSCKNVARITLFFRWIDCDAPMDVSSIPEANNTKVNSSISEAFSKNWVCLMTYIYYVLFIINVMFFR